MNKNLTNKRSLASLHNEVLEDFCDQPELTQFMAMEISTEDEDGRDTSDFGGVKEKNKNDVSGGGRDGVGGKNCNDVDSIESVGTADDKSGDSGGDVCGIAAATVAGGRVVLKKLQRGNNYRMAEDLNFLHVMEEILPITEEEWTSVVNGHNESNPDFDQVGERNEDSLHC